MADALVEENTCVIASPLGNLLLGCHHDFITSILFKENLPLLPGHHTLLQEAERQLKAYFAGSLQTFDFPMRQTGSNFQQKVWNALTTIPYGQTISYHELALQLGDAKSIRAAASANGKNNLAIVVPCHRVIGSDGSLTGYAGGLHRKQWLLNHERKLSGKTTQGSLF